MYTTYQAGKPWQFAGSFYYATTVLTTIGKVVGTDDKDIEGVKDLYNMRSPLAMPHIPVHKTRKVVGFCHNEIAVLDLSLIIDKYWGCDTVLK